MTRYTAWRVQVTTPSGIYGGRPLDDELVASLLYRRRALRVGKEYTRVELIGIGAGGDEHVIEHNELRTDLYAKVQAPERETFEQMELL